MSATAKWEGERIYADLASRLKTEDDVEHVMSELVKGFAQGKELHLIQFAQVQDFYARKFYECIVFSEAKKALAEHFISVKQVIKNGSVYN